MAYAMLRPAPGLSEVQTAAAVLQGYAEVAAVEETELYVWAARWHGG
jgi:hypothetical protein